MSDDATNEDLSQQLLGFGQKYAQKTCGWVLENDGNYVRWCCANATGGRMQEFAAWSEKNQGRLKIDFGKHKGKAYQWVFDNDPAYLQWCRGQDPEEGKPMRHLVDWAQTARSSSAAQGAAIVQRTAVRENQWGYVGYNEWGEGYVGDGKANWGVGNCWDYLGGGMGGCGMLGECGGHHPMIRVTGLGAGGARCEIVRGNMVPAWQRALQARGFQRRGLGNVFENPAMAVADVGKGVPGIGREFFEGAGASSSAGRSRPY